MKEYENDIKRPLEERGWDNLRPADLAKSICIEAAELLEVFQWSNQSLDEVKKDEKKIEQVKKELADVLNYCFDLSVLLELDTERIMRDKLKKVEEKYPAHIFKKGTSPEPGTEEAYLNVKRKYRREGV